MVELLAGLRDDGVAVALVTHEPRFASWADRAVFLRDGAVVDETAAAPLVAVVDVASGAGAGPGGEG